MTSDSTLTLRSESPDQPEVRALLDSLDAYLIGLYEPDQNHLLDLASLMGKGVHFLVARQGGQAVGCGAARMMPAEAAGGAQPYGEIKRMYVQPGSRGRRLGARLLFALESHMRGRGIVVARLETGSRQPEALRLYERAGYQKSLPFGGYEANGTSLFYEKKL